MNSGSTPCNGNIEDFILVSIDGPRGVGKSFLANALRRSILNAGGVAWVTSEPTNGSTGDDALDRLSHGVNDIATLLLFCADRALHFEGNIGLLPGTIIICDRSSLSTWVYQGTSPEKRMLIESIHEHMPKPDICFILAASDEAWAKANGSVRKGGGDRGGLIPSDIKNNLFGAYMTKYLQGSVRTKLAKSFHIIEAYQPIDKMVDKCLSLIRESDKEASNESA